MLELISPMRSEIINIDNEHFNTALTLKLEKDENKQIIIKKDEPAVGEISLTTLNSSSCTVLKLLHVDDCPKLTSQEIMALVNHFKNLRDVSLSFSLISDNLLEAISDEHVQLETLRIEAHSETKSLPFVSDKAWQYFSNHSPNINLVLQSYLTEENDYKLILKPCVPVTHLFLGDSTPSNIIDDVANFCPGLKEIVIAAYGPDTIDTTLLLIAKKCTRISAIGLGDCEITCNALLEFITLCCERLKTFYIWETSIQEDSKMDIETVSAKISLLLGRTWNPESVPFC
ncbi:F-box/LRR-repeat protein 3-like [Leptopilina boulardi]|uniref:F-box/LRR-repeat protein 3-like n=1 Tax=Leptopilina boulardi TaxID=63433 RepID=UPI0021F683B2|nr:F-box/LRR-repeat protein 3-like [Leptopilina boulardi]XP_051163511.1 F-box/LRR-repeat protein 3-like [Leptopilina boulardi]